MDIVDLIARGARWHRSRVAVIDGDTGRTSTFGEVDDRSNRLANALLAHDPAPGERVALLLPNRPEFIEADLAIAKAGKVKVPLNPRLAEGEREHIIGSSGASTLIVDAAHAPFVAAVRDRLPALRRVIVVDGEAGTDDAYEPLLARGSTRAPGVRVPASAPSFILYTSGTTGRPKGATASVGSRVAATGNMLQEELSATSTDVMIHAAPLSHGSGSKILAYWIRGAANLVVRKFDPEQFLQLVTTRGGSASFLVPTMIAMLVTALDRSRHDVSGLRTLSYGGAPIAPERLTQALEALGPVFVQVYGSCEAPHPVTVLSKADHLGPADQPRLGSAGREVLGVEIRMVDKAGAVVPDGEPGELQVRGANVMLGYWENPAATAEMFVDGWYRTGDVARRDEDGYVYLIDRERDMVISGGLNVYPAEVEAAILKHTAVAEVAVIGVPDPVWGEAVKAFVVRAPGATLDEAAVLEHCRIHLAGYKKPKTVEFVADLPKGSTGKLLKRELRDRYWSNQTRKV